MAKTYFELGSAECEVHFIFTSFSPIVHFELPEIQCYA